MAEYGSFYVLGEAGPGKSVVLAPVRMMVKFEWKVEFVGTAAEEKKKAEARARAAYRRRQRKFEENGVIEGFAQINWSFMAARDELKRRGFSVELMNQLKSEVLARVSPWNKQHYADYVNYFIYQYFLACSEVQIETLPVEQQAAARKVWEKSLRPFKRREPWLCPML